MSSIFSYLIKTKAFENLTKEESEKILMIAIDKLSDHMESVSFTSAVTIFKSIMNNNFSDQELIDFLFEKDYFKRSRTSTNSDYVLQFINNIVGKSKFEDAEKLINTIQNSFPDYHNFPIIIMNNNITKEEKIKALKLIYRKKDFPQYKLYFRDNLKDLDDLDTFIEATIIQNNRVREKEDNIIKLFKDIFISGVWGENLLKKRTYFHLDEFSKKYSTYFFNASFTKKFYNETVGSLSTNEHIRQDQYEAFINAIFSAVPLEKRVEAMSKSVELESLGTNFSSEFKNALIDEDFETCKLLLPVFTTWSKTKTERMFAEIGKDNFKLVLQTFPEEMKEYLNSFKLIDYKRDVETDISPVIDRGYGYGKSAETDSTLINALINPETFSETLFLDDDDLNCLGFNYEKALNRISVKNRWGGYSSVTTQSIFLAIEDVMKTLFAGLSALSSTSDFEFLEKIVDKFFARFEVDASILADNAMEIYNNDKLKAYNSNSYYGARYKNPAGHTQSVQSIMAIIDRAIDCVTSLYTRLGDYKPEYLEKKELIIENLQETKNTLDLICAI